jgi:subtilisin family serine protease
MRRSFLLAAVALVFATVVGGAPRWQAVVAQAPVPELETIIIQRDVQARAQRADGHEPTLADLGFERIAVPPGYSAAEYAAELEDQPGILSAEPDVRVYAAALPDDPFFAANQATYMGLIGAPAAWDIVTGAGEPIVVAVIDSGIDTRHPEFGGRLWENTRDASTDGIDDDSNGCPDDRYGCRFIQLDTKNAATCGYTTSQPLGNVLDDHGRQGSVADSHGTLVSGIIGAAGNNGTGIAGMAWDVQIMSIKVLDCGTASGGLPSGTMFDVARGIDYARLNGARVINLSLSGRPGDQSADTQDMRAAIAAAEREGIIIVAAAGNHAAGESRVGTAYPAAYTQYSNVIAVGASDVNGRWATFSNYGPAVDIAAPGVSIASTRRTDIGLAQPYGADPQGGTSYSAPLVAGVFALMMSRNPDLSMAEYIDIMKSTATPAVAAEHGQNWAGAGIVDAGKAVARVPMSLSGDALHDFLDVPSGTEIRAFIGGVECGRTTSTLFGPIALYSMRVKSAIELQGCGAPGVDVRFQVGGVPVPEPVRWGGRDVVISYRNYDLSSVSPPPGQLVIQELGTGWSNIAQLDPGGSLPGALNSVSSPWTAVLKWDGLAGGELGGVYRRFIKDAPAYVSDMTSLERYDAIWVDTSRTNVATTNPEPQPGRTITLNPGWNNFVYTGTSAAVPDALSDIAGKYTQVLHFDNVSQAWSSYLPGRQRYLQDFGGLFQLKTYWILVTETVTLTMR